MLNFLQLQRFPQPTARVVPGEEQASTILFAEQGSARKPESSGTSDQAGGEDVSENGSATAFTASTVV